MKTKIFKNLMIGFTFLTSVLSLTDYRIGFSQELSKEKPKAVAERAVKIPKANVIVKEGSTFIKIKDLDLTADQTEKLEDVIQDKISDEDMPKGLDMKMTLNITPRMLKKAGIDVSILPKGVSDDEEDEFLEDDHDYKINFKLHDKGNEGVKIFHDMTVKKDEKFRSVVVIGGDLDFDGEAKDVVVILGSMKIGPNAKINGDCAVILGASEISPAAFIKGNQVTINGGAAVKKIFKFVLIPGAIVSFFALTPFIYLFKVAWWLILFGFAILLFSIFAGTNERSREYIKANPLASFGIGILGLLMIFPLMLFLLLSIIGIPLIPVFAILFLIALFGGYAVSAFFLGSIILVKIFKTTVKWALLLGIFVLGIVSLIPVFGCFILWVAVTLGFGAVCYSVFQAVFRKKTNTAPPQPPIQTT